MAEMHSASTTDKTVLSITVEIYLQCQDEVLKDNVVNCRKESRVPRLAVQSMTPKRLVAEILFPKVNS